MMLSKRARHLLWLITFSLLVSVPPLLAEDQTSLPLVLPGIEGAGFRDIRITWDASGSAIRFNAHYDNLGHSGWEKGMKFELYIRGEDGSQESGKWCGIYEVLILRPVTTSGPVAGSVRLLERGGRCVPNSVSVDSFDDAEDEIIAAEVERRRKAQLAAEAKRAQERARDRARQLAALPRLRPLADQLPLAGDEKCLNETVDAMRLEGLEKRKRLHDLVSLLSG